MPTTRSAASRVDTATARDMETEIREAVELAVTNMNTMSGGAGVPVRLTKQLGDHFWNAYLETDRSVLASIHPQEPRAYIKYDGDGAKEMTCVMEFNGWGSEPESKPTHGSMTASQAEARAAFTMRGWDVRDPERASTLGASTSQSFTQGHVTGSAPSAGVAIGEPRDELEFRDAVHDALREANCLHSATEEYRSQLQDQVDAVIPELYGYLKPTANSGDHIYFSGLLGDPATLAFSVLADEDPGPHRRVDVSMDIEYFDAGHIAVGPANITPLGSTASRQDKARSLCSQSNYDGLSYRIDKAAHQLAASTPDSVMDGHILGISNLLPQIGQQIGFLSDVPTEVECGIRFQPDPSGTGGLGTIFVRDKERAQREPTAITRIRLGTMEDGCGSLEPSVRAYTFGTDAESESVVWI